MSCDFRRPRLHQFFGLDNNVGATSVLLGEIPLQEALQDVAGQPNLRILASGPVPPNPAEILSLDRVRHLVNVLGANADVVLLDCPPVLPVTDTLLVSRLCDSVFVLAVAAETKKNDLRRTYGLLAQVGAPARGTIINRVAAARLDYSGYGYGYGYYGETTKNQTREKDSPRATSAAPNNGNHLQAADPPIVPRAAGEARGGQSSASTAQSTHGLFDENLAVSIGRPDDERSKSGN